MKINTQHWICEVCDADEPAVMDCFLCSRSFCKQCVTKEELREKLCVDCQPIYERMADTEFTTADSEIGKIIRQELEDKKFCEACSNNWWIGSEVGNGSYENVPCPLCLPEEHKKFIDERCKVRIGDLR